MTKHSFWRDGSLPSGKRDCESLGQQAVRVALDCARRFGAQPDDSEDISIGFMHGKFLPDALRQAAWTGEDEKRLECMAETYVRGCLYRMRKRSKRVVSMFGLDGTEASGPAGQLVSRQPGPEESLLRKQIREYVAYAMARLTPQQVDLFVLLYDQGERAVDVELISGRSAQAVRSARLRLRIRLRKLLVEFGLDSTEIEALLNELDRMRGRS